MKWEHVAFCEYKAVGKNGDFLVWKDGRVWKARYRSTDKTKLFHLPFAYSKKEVMKICEENYYWE